MTTVKSVNACSYSINPKYAPKVPKPFTFRTQQECDRVLVLEWKIATLPFEVMQAATGQFTEFAWRKYEAFPQRSISAFLCSLYQDCHSSNTWSCWHVSFDKAAPQTTQCHCFPLSTARGRLSQQEDTSFSREAARWKKVRHHVWLLKCSTVVVIILFDQSLVCRRFGNTSANVENATSGIRTGNICTVYNRNMFYYHFSVCNWKNQKASFGFLPFTE